MALKHESNYNSYFKTVSPYSDTYNLCEKNSLTTGVKEIFAYEFYSFLMKRKKMLE